MITMSMSSGPRPARGERTPRRSRTGRRFTYWRNVRRIGMRSPHRETWSGTPGAPIAPRNIRPDRPQDDPLERPELLDPVLRHHPTGARVGLAAPVEVSPGPAEAEATAGGLQDPDAFRHHFLPDPVARDHRDPVRGHL